MKKALNCELIRAIFATIGFGSIDNFGKVGVSLNSFICDRTLNIKFDDSQSNKYALYCGTTSYGDSSIRVLVTDIIDKDERSGNFHEYILSYSVDGSPITILKFSFHEFNMYSNDDCEFLFVSDIKDEFVEVSTTDALQACFAFMKMADMGLIWEPCNNYNDLYEKLIKIV